MRSLGYFAPLLVLALSTAPGAARAAGLAWPGTEPAAHARAYFEAYNSGEPAMRAFWTAHGSPAALAQRPVDARLGVYAEMRGEHGALTPLRVIEADDDFVTVRVRTSNAAELDIRFQCEAAPPHGLIALRVTDAQSALSNPEPEPTGPPPTDAEIVAALSAELDSLAKAGAFSGAVTLDKDGTTLFEKAYGLADRAKKTPNRTDTRFNLGSINKIFTNLAIVQLVQQHIVELGDPVSHYLDDYPKEAGDKITLQMLLDHTSGVPDVLRNPDTWKDPAKIRTMADWYRLVRDMPLDFEPGTKNQYSNGGFVLLGAIVARASGEDYYDYIRKHVYAPAGMKRTDHYASDEKIEGLAKGYTRHSDGAGPRPPGAAPPAPDAALHEALRLGRGSPAGGGYSTTGDLVRFSRALRAGKLYDLRRGSGMLSAKPEFGIAGGSPGVNGLLVLQGPYTLAALANLDPPAAERLSKTVGRMLRRASGPPPAEKRDVQTGAGR